MPLQAGRYRVGAPVGHGGTSVVHRGFDRALRRPVAIKVLARSRTGAHPALAEARAAAQISHPNIARVYDFGRSDTGAPFLVMEYVPGGTLADRLRDTGPLPLAETARVAADVACALAAAHAHGLVHRDIKPGNVMPGPSHAKVVDFGVATAAGSGSVAPDGLVWGTPLYLSPEQLRGEPVRPAADVYALGLLLHECLTGSPPWRGATTEEVLTQRRLQPVPMLPGTLGLPPALVDFCRRCLSPLPAKRPTALEAVETLRHFTGVRPMPFLSLPQPASTRPRRLNVTRPDRRPQATPLGRPDAISTRRADAASTRRPDAVPTRRPITTRAGRRTRAARSHVVTMAGLAVIVALIGLVIGQLTASAPAEDGHQQPATTATAPSGPSRTPTADA